MSIASSPAPVSPPVVVVGTETSGQVPPPLAGTPPAVVAPPVAAAPTPEPPAAAPAPSVFEDDSPGLFRRVKDFAVYEGAPMMVSTVVHTVLFLVMALCLGNAVTPEKPKNDSPSFITEGGDAEVEEIERFVLAEPPSLNTEVDLSPQELRDLAEIPPDLEVTAGIPDGDANSTGMGSAAGPESNLGGLGLNITARGLGPNAMGGLGGFDGKGGMGGTGKGTGLPGKGATFFGVKSTGQRICFVVDNSGSMKGPKWNTAVTELIAAVEKLNGRQAFYILFFSDKPLPMFSPNHPQNMVFASPQIKEKLAQWLYNVELKKGTNGSETMKMALALKPDIIYVLGDGEFTDKVVPELLAMEGVRTKINTIGFNMREGSRGDKDFSSIAKKFRGTYRNVKSN